MSVPKHKRQQSQFEVYHHFYKLRREITELLLRDFGYSKEKAVKRIEHQFHDSPYEELDEKEQTRYTRVKKRDDSFNDWFIVDERKAVIDYLRNIQRCLFSANNIYPQYKEELIQRRLLQEEALGYCTSIKQELQYAIEVLPVDINKYIRYAEMIDREIALIKGWRQSDNKFKKIIPDFDESNS